MHFKKFRSFTCSFTFQNMIGYLWIVSLAPSPLSKPLHRIVAILTCMQIPASTYGGQHMHMHLNAHAHGGILMLVPYLKKIYMTEELSQPTKCASKIHASIFLTMKATILDTHGISTTFQKPVFFSIIKKLQPQHLIKNHLITIISVSIKEAI